MILLGAYRICTGRLPVLEGGDVDCAGRLRNCSCIGDVYCFLEDLRLVEQLQVLYATQVPDRAALIAALHAVGDCGYKREADGLFPLLDGIVQHGAVPIDIGSAELR